MEKKETRKLKDLKNWENNPRSIKEKDYERLKTQIRDLGQYKPLIITEDGIVLGGNMRLRAYTELGIEDVWVSVVKADTEEERMRFALSDNDRAGYYDEDLLANLSGNYPDFNWEDYAVDMREPRNLKEVLDQFTEVVEDEAPPLDKDKVVSKEGELYKLGRHRLLCGDSTKEADVERLMGGQLANLIFTDPPYNVNYNYSKYTDGRNMKWDKIANDNIKTKDFYAFLVLVFTNLHKFSTDNASFYVWHADRTVREFWQALEDSGFYVSQRITWVKDRFVLAMGQHFHRMFEPCLHGWKQGKSSYVNKSITDWGDVWNLTREELLADFDLWKLDRDAQIKYQHPTQKPVSLAERGIKKSTKEGEIVVDAFGGSGSTLIACEQLDRICYTIELDPAYCDVIRKRYANFIGKSEDWEKETPVIPQ